MNIKIAGSVIAAAESAKNKKKWIKPEVEVISSDLIKGGPITSLNEGETTFGLRGQHS